MSYYRAIFPDRLQPGWSTDTCLRHAQRIPTDRFTNARAHGSRTADKMSDSNNETKVTCSPSLLSCNRPDNRVQSTGHRQIVLYVVDKDNILPKRSLTMLASGETGSSCYQETPTTPMGQALAQKLVGCCRSQCPVCEVLKRGFSTVLWSTRACTAIKHNAILHQASHTSRYEMSFLILQLRIYAAQRTLILRPLCTSRSGLRSTE
jgi:hypothetical protein